MSDYSYETIYEIESSLKNGSQFLRVDGNTIFTDNVSGEYMSDTNLWMFARLKQGVIDSYYTGKLYYCKIWFNDELVRDYIPCYRISDNKPGLYDLVTNEFYTNDSGSNTDFTIGPEVE